MSDDVQAACDPNSPVMKAWAEFQGTESFKNSLGWAKRSIDEQTVLGSLWHAFEKGFQIATEKAAQLHESINPSSDDERHNKTHGAGAMGAVIEYRDQIRKQNARFHA